MHPIRVVARRTGLTPDVLRAWERRYCAVRPSKVSGRRLYDDAQVERLLLLRRAAGAGRRIGRISGLSTAKLRELVAKDEAAMQHAPAPGPIARGRGNGSPLSNAPDLAPVLERCIDAVRELDDIGLEKALSRAMVAFGQVGFVEKVALPLMRAIGDLWQEGELRVAQEHLASVVVRTIMGDMGNGRGREARGPFVVIATPSGQHHELGALAAFSTAASQGWRVTYLGPNLPADEIAAAARIKNASAVALSIVYPADDPKLDRELRRLRRLLPDGTSILVGGRAADGYGATLDSIQAVRSENMAALRANLGELRCPPQAS